jgi:hypothetical protein
MRQQNVVMGFERPDPKINCKANYRTILSSKRVLHFGIKQFPDQEIKRKNLVMGPKGQPNTKTDWPMDHGHNLTSRRPENTELSKNDFKKKEEKLVVGHRWVPHNKTDWPTDCRS